MGKYLSPRKGDVLVLEDNVADELIAGGLAREYNLAEVNGTIDITENGTFDVGEYAAAEVAVPEPTGSIAITANGTVDVTDYAEAVVNVPPSDVFGDYCRFTSYHPENCFVIGGRDDDQGSRNYFAIQAYGTSANQQCNLKPINIGAYEGVVAVVTTGNYWVQGVTGGTRLWNNIIFEYGIALSIIRPTAALVELDVTYD